MPTLTNKQKGQKRQRRKNRVRIKTVGRTNRPRLTVFRSLQHIYAQVIDDQTGKTIAAASDQELKDIKGKKKIEIATMVGKEVAKKAVAAKITKVTFDRSGYQYHGRVKALADGARDGGLEF